MKVKVVYFAAAREAASTKGEMLTLPPGTLTADLAREILRLHPSLEGVLTSARFSVNFGIVEGNSPLHDGDEVGVLPPVAGG